MVGKRRSVRSDCRFVKRIKDENMVGYDHLDNALAEGRRPCKLCLRRATTQPTSVPTSRGD